jgi:hypothetical protein
MTLKKEQQLPEFEAGPVKKEDMVNVCKHRDTS